MDGSPIPSKVRQQIMEDKELSKKVTPAILAQIEDGVSPGKYLAEGLSIMEDVFSLLDKVKSG
jgi:hypothetical protein